MPHDENQFNSGDTLFYLGLLLTSVNFIVAIWAIAPLAHMIFGVAIPGVIAFAIGSILMFRLLWLWANAGFAGTSALVMAAVVPAGSWLGWQEWGASSLGALGLAATPPLVFLGWKALPE